MSYDKDDVEMSGIVYVNFGKTPLEITNSQNCYGTVQMAVFKLGNPEAYSRKEDFQHHLIEIGKVEKENFEEQERLAMEYIRKLTMYSALKDNALVAICDCFYTRNDKEGLYRGLVVSGIIGM